MVPLDVISLVDPSDEMYNFVEYLDIREDITTVVCHGNSDGSVLSIRYYKDGKYSSKRELDAVAIGERIKENQITI